MIEKSHLARDHKAIRACAFEADDTSSLAIFESFASSHLPFAVPKMSKQKAGDRSQRLTHLLGGVPFNCAAYPWPKDSLVGKDMQPVAQLNLLDVGARLGMPLGGGLLQIWCAVYPAAGDKKADPFFLRVVPESNLSDPLEEYSPSNPVWLRQPNDAVAGNDSGDLTDDALFAERTHLVVFDSSVLEKPVMQWSDVGQMFPPALVAIGDGLEPETFEQLFESLEALQTHIAGPFSGIYLGGYGGAAGGAADPSYISAQEGRLLLHICDKHGLHMSVIADASESAIPNFRLVYKFH